MLRKNRGQSLEKLLPALSNLYRAMATSRDAFLAQFNLSRSQMELLLSLKQGPRTTSALAKEFSISASAVSQMIDQLIEKDLVERIHDLSDRRVTNIQLSEHGKKLFKDINKKYFEHVEQRFETVSVKEIENLLTTVNKITDTISQQ